jgi:hypothetical protein
MVSGRESRTGCYHVGDGMNQRFRRKVTGTLMLCRLPEALRAWPSSGWY